MAFNLQLKNPRHGTSPLTQMEREERYKYQQRLACLGCSKRPVVVGGDGACKAYEKQDGKVCQYFDLDEEVV